MSVMDREKSPFEPLLNQLSLVTVTMAYDKICTGLD